MVSTSASIRRDSLGVIPRGRRVDKPIHRDPAIGLALRELAAALEAGDLERLKRLARAPV